MTTSKSVPWYFTPMIALSWWVCIELGLLHSFTFPSAKPARKVLLWRDA